MIDQEECADGSSRNTFEERQNDEINLYDYWKAIVTRKKLLIGIFLVPLVIVTVVSLSQPRSYRGESEMSVTAGTDPDVSSALSAPYIVGLMGNPDAAARAKIFKNNPDAIIRVAVSSPKKTPDKMSIAIDATTVDVIPQAFQDIYRYISMLPEIKEEVERLQAENDLRMASLIEAAEFKAKRLIEARKENLLFLNLVTETIKKRQLTILTVNPSDLIERDANLAVQIKNLQQEKRDLMMKKELTSKVAIGKLSAPSITQQPSNAEIKQRIILTGLMSLLAGIFVVFVQVYIDRTKERRMSGSTR